MAKVIARFLVIDKCGNKRVIEKDLGELIGKNLKELNPQTIKEKELQVKLAHGAALVQKDWCFSTVILRSFISG